MTITNHSKGNYHICDTSVMHGSIIVTTSEWEAIRAWLQVRYEVAEEHNQTYQRDVLVSLGHRPNPQPNKPFSIGVEATHLMFEAFGLPRYKDQNYSITIKS